MIWFYDALLIADRHNSTLTSGKDSANIYIMLADNVDRDQIISTYPLQF